MSISDEQIGKNLARLRGEKSQAELADSMRRRGYKWSQATVWAVEKGERPLRLTEAHDVADELGTFASFLTQDEESSVLHEAMSRVFAAHSKLEKAIAEFLNAQENLAFTADQLADGIRGTVQEESVKDWLNCSIEYTAQRVWLELVENDKVDETVYEKLHGPAIHDNKLEDADYPREYLDIFLRSLPGASPISKPGERTEAVDNVIVGGFGQTANIEDEIPENVEEAWAGRFAASPKSDIPEDHTP